MVYIKPLLFFGQTKSLPIKNGKAFYTIILNA